MNVCDLNKTLIKFDMHVQYSWDIIVPVLADIVCNRVNADCTHLDLVHKTPVDEVPTAIASFQGRILVGVGRMLRLYDMGRKKLLRKCENKVSDMNVTWLVVKVKLYLFLIVHCARGVQVLSICSCLLHALAILHSRQLLHFGRLGWLQRSQSGYGDSSRLVTLFKDIDSSMEPYCHDKIILLGPK